MTESHAVEASAAGVLVLVATPIGNLEDLSPRARRELETADVIACEDTRRTGKLLELTGIGRRPLLMVNDHTEHQRSAAIIGRLDAGQRVVVVTDAGMPGISDPGERLVKAAVEAGHRVSVVPGPSAASSALVASGLPTGRFCFEGFLPRKGRARSERLAELSAEHRTMIIFESPHRVAATLADLAEVLGADRKVAVARELTKLYEEFWRGTAGDGATWFAEEAPRGEVVLVVDGAAPAAPATDDDVLAALAAALEAGASKRDAAADVAKRLGVARNHAYDLALTL